MRCLRIASISDIHLIHPTTQTKDTISCLNKFFSNHDFLSNIDIVFICGDVWDQACTREESSEADYWIARLLRLCVKHRVILRVMRGTFSHDRDQSRSFTAINEYSQIGADVRYINDIEIEYIDELNISILYVPDEIRDTTDKIYLSVKEALQEKNLSHVDFAVMHGAFEHQVPALSNEHKHILQRYLDIVREYIFIGHIHTHSIVERAIAQGSFNRLSHGDEIPKGFIYAEVEKGVSRLAKFIENTDATIYKSIELKNWDIEKTLSIIDKKVSKLPVDSFVRLVGNSTNPIFSNMDLIIKKYAHLTFSKKITKEDKEDLSTTDDSDIYTPIQITNENIVGLMMDRVNIKYNDKDISLTCEAILNEVVREV